MAALLTRCTRRTELEHPRPSFLEVFKVQSVCLKYPLQQRTSSLASSSKHLARHEPTCPRDASSWKPSHPSGTRGATTSATVAACVPLTNQL